MPFLQQQPSPPATRPQPPSPPPIAAIPDPVTTIDEPDTDWDAHSLFSGSGSSTYDDNDEPEGDATEKVPVDAQWDSDQDAEGEIDELESSDDEESAAPADDPVEPSPANVLRAMKSGPHEVTLETNDTLSTADAEYKLEVYPEVGLQDDTQPTAAAAQDQKKKKRSPENDEGDDNGTPSPTRRPRLGYISLRRLPHRLDDKEEYVPSRSCSVCESDEEREEIPLPSPPKPSAKKRKRAVKEEEDEDYGALTEQPARTRPRKSRKLSAPRTDDAAQEKVFTCPTIITLPDGTSEVCNETFSRPSDVTRHQRSKHEQLGYKCRVCKQILSRKDAAQRHARGLHPGLTDEQLREVAKVAYESDSESDAEVTWPTASSSKTRSTKGTRSAKQPRSRPRSTREPRRPAPVHMSDAEWTLGSEGEDTQALDALA